MNKAQIVFGIAGLVCILGVVLYLTGEDVDTKTAGLVLFVAGFFVAAGARFAAGLRKTR